MMTLSQLYITACGGQVLTWPSLRRTYRVGQIKWHYFTFLLVTD